MLNYLVSDNLGNKLKWYIKAHAYSSIGALNLVLTFFEHTKYRELAIVIGDLTNLLEKFGSSNNFKDEIRIIDANLKNIEFLISKQDIEEDKKNELLTVILSVKKNINRINSIIKNPEYKEKFKISKIIYSAINDLISTYPDVLYGDLIGSEGPNVGKRIQFHYNQSGKDNNYLFCGYEVQALLVSLLSNAVENIKSKGNIFVSAKTANLRVKLVFEDDGKPLSNNEITHIKSKKFSSKKNTKRMNYFQNVYDVLSKYNGILEFKNDEDSKTTTCIIELPFKSV